MKAQPGDWLVVHSHIEGRHDRRAEILATGPDGCRIDFSNCTLLPPATYVKLIRFPTGSCIILTSPPDQANVCTTPVGY